MAVDLILEGFDFTRGVLDVNNFKKRLRKHVGKATGIVGLMAKKEIKKKIREGKYIANSGATVIMKGSTIPLIGQTRTLERNISRRKLGWNKIVVGVLKSAPVIDPITLRPGDILSIAKQLHEGQTFKVSPKMRRLWFHLADKFDAIKPLSASTTHIRIPPRPFLLPVESRRMLRIYEKLWGNAVRLALLGVK